MSDLRAAHRQAFAEWIDNQVWDILQRAVAMDTHYYRRARVLHPPAPRAGVDL